MRWEKSIACISYMYDDKQKTVMDLSHGSDDLSRLLEEFANLPEIDWQHLEIPDFEDGVVDDLRSDLAKQNVDANTILVPNLKSASAPVRAMRSSDDDKSLSMATMIPVSNSRSEIEIDCLSRPRSGMMMSNESIESISLPELTASSNRLKALQAMIYHHRRAHGGNLETAFQMQSLVLDYPSVKEHLTSGHGRIPGSLRKSNLLKQPEDMRGSGTYWLTPHAVDMARMEGW